MGHHLIVLVVAAGVTFVLTLVVERLARRRGLVVQPDERRIHTRPTPAIGGLAMYLAFVTAMAVASQLSGYRPVFERSSDAIGVIAGATVIFLVGFVDDVREVSAPAKMAGQVLAGSTLYLFGVTLFYFRIPFGDLLVLSADLAPLITVLWVIGMANAINFIDGLDGLAAGIVAIAAGAFFLYSDQLVDAQLLAPDNAGPLVAVVVLGICLGFLPHNFSPARIFMGDSGAMLLGLLMAATTMLVGGQTEAAFSGQTFFFFAPLIVPFFILGVPIVDTAFAILRRATRRSGVATADKGHLHHVLMHMGHGPRRAVVILWTWTALLSAVVLYPAYTGKGDAWVPLGVIAMGLALYTWFHPGLRSKRELVVIHDGDEGAGTEGNGNDGNGEVVDEAAAAIVSPARLRSVDDDDDAGPVPLPSSDR